MLELPAVANGTKAILPKPDESYTMIPNWIFEDRHFRNLSLQAKALLLYLAAGPGSGRPKYFLPPGIHCASKATMADDLDLSVEGLNDALQELESAGWTLSDEENRLVFIPAVVTKVDNPCHFSGTLKKLARLPDSPLRQEYFKLILGVTAIQERNWETTAADLMRQLEEGPALGLDLSFLSEIKLLPATAETADG